MIAAPVISYDPDVDVLTIDGFKFARALLTQFTASPLGLRFRIVSREDGVITVSQERDGLEAAARELFNGLTELLDAVERELIASASSRSGRDDDDFREEFPEDYERRKRLRAILAKAAAP